MALRTIPDPGFSGDDGSADPALAEALAAWDRDRTAEPGLLAALAGARLLVPVVAVAAERDPQAGEQTGEKTSEMALPTLTAPDGRRALPVFTSSGTMARWDAAARPVAVPVHQALRAAAQEGADTLVVDLAGPVTYPLQGAALRALAEGRTGVPPADDPAVTAALRAVLAAEPLVRSAQLLPGRGTDGTLALCLADRDPSAVRDLAGRVAGALAGDEVLRTRLVRGLDLAVLPADAPGSPEPFYRRRPVPTKPAAPPERRGWRARRRRRGGAAGGGAAEGA